MTDTQTDNRHTCTNGDDCFKQTCLNTTAINKDD